ncbi:MAG: sugar ABC transporter permease [Lachnospiraceae bacterium]|nr:sugar ABC transporter permease [Lachnospiraceae bacterium]
MSDKVLKKYFPIFVLPTLIAFTIAFIIPFFMGIYLSFCKFMTVGDAEFTGLSNYIYIFTKDESFLTALWRTVRFTLVSVVLINLGAFALALLLTKKLPGTNIFRTIFFMPNLIGGIVLGYIWGEILDTITQKVFGLTFTHSSQDFGFWGLIVVMCWQMMGYMMIIYIAGIQNIPEDVMEAAKIDGATPFQILYKITIPLVMPSVTICLFLTLSNSFKLYDQNLALNGREARTRLIALDIGETFYKGGPFAAEFAGRGQAKAVIFFIIVAIVTFAQLRLTRSKEVES